ncbi:MAG: Na(+)-translocating NADH-quinone reductase subunit A [Saprospiraceae bacterium]
MKGNLQRAVLLAGTWMSAGVLSAQSNTTSGSDLFLFVMVGIALLLFFGMLISLADNLIGVEAKKNNIDVERGGLTMIPGLRQIFGGKAPVYANNIPTTVLKKGHDILLEGAATGGVTPAQGVTRYAIQPPNFLGLQPIPKVTAEPGTSVKAGDQLFFDKNMPEVAFVAPVSGEVIEINRGAKRAITEIVILADKEQQYRTFNAPAANADRATLLAFLKESGAWSLLRQRPYNIIPDPNAVPRDIFVSTFDSAPLAPDMSVVVAGQEAAFQKGLEVLANVTTGQVHLGLDGRGDKAPADVFVNAAHCSKRFFKGKHPVGNVGVQIHHTAPVANGDVVWTLGVQEVITLGKLFLTGKFDASRVVALTGVELNKPQYVRTFAGANMGELLKGNVKGENVRIISGDVLSGTQKSENTYLNWFDDQITVVAEGDYFEMFGWLVPLAPRPSISKTFLRNALFSGLTFEADTNTHGEKRAFVVTTDYESVMPMDIYTQQLMKSIVVNDLERMEKLGILELVEEDVALCEFACVSKQPLQHILREGLETIREQG